ncbi:hypothetical protein AAFF_G00284300 [Aldrovandia affinis]|uniref:Secreted protein n=1 Tax=Aldrovandia affinis TaxID=143900 RepID=A0AAD7TAK6_9TELE|nr:hypothetical protein AAFF_G00284300 [Aldrovandia affinis]
MARSGLGLSGVVLLGFSLWAFDLNPVGTRQALASWILHRLKEIGRAVDGGQRSASTDSHNASHNLRLCIAAITSPNRKSPQQPACPSCFCSQKLHTFPHCRTGIREYILR